MSELHRVTIDGNQCGGRPCLPSLHTLVTDALDRAAAGVSQEEILEVYPLRKPQNITAAPEYAGRLTNHPAWPDALVNAQLLAST
jgi:uncharacterized protein (DUF433 family)